jgi:hypothetical protein
MEDKDIIDYLKTEPNNGFCKTCHCGSIGNILQKGILTFTCQHDLFSHQLQILNYGSWSHFTKCLPTHSKCLGYGSNIDKNVYHNKHCRINP